ncbi:MAG: DinB family protein [Thermoanaerobaculia bacterium]
MRIRSYTAALITAIVSTAGTVHAQAPVASAFRAVEADEAKNLVAAAETIPADKYSYKPTPAQMTFGEIVVHLSQGNDYFCGEIAGTKAPTRAKVTATSPKAELVARLKETFEFCGTSLATLDDSKLSEELPFFGGRKMSRAGVMTVATGDWADHYSQSAIYMRLNGMLPPTAKKPN